MEKLKKYPLFNKWILVIVLFSFIQGLCLIHHGDDLYWFQGSSYNNILVLIVIIQDILLILLLS